MSTESDVLRTDDPAGGDTFATRDKASGAKTQGVHLDPEVMGDILSHSSTGGAAENTREPKSSAGRIFRASVILDPSVPSDRYLMVFDKAAAPVNTDIPVRRRLVPAGGEAGIDLGSYGHELTTGIAVAISTTHDTLTLPAGAEGFFTVGYF